MIDFYQIRSPLSQITEERMHRFINALSDALGEKLEKDAVCSAHLLPAGLGLTPAHSLALVSPGSLVTWSTLAGNPALWVIGPSWERRSRRSKASF